MDEKTRKAKELELLELEEAEYQASKNQSGTGEALLMGAIDGATLKYGDEIAGGLSNPKGGIKALLGYGSQDPDVQAYQSTRDKARKAIEKPISEHPVAGTIGGIAGGLFGPGKFLAPLKGAKAIAGAAGLGGVMGLGGSEAELANKELGRAALDTGLGAGIGGATQGVANKLAPMLSRKAPSVTSKVDEFSVGSSASGDLSEGALDKAKRAALKTFKAEPRPDAEEIDKAVAVLTEGKMSQAPGYMRTKNKMVQNLAKTVLDEPTIAGEMERRPLDKIWKGIEGVGDELSGQAGGLSEFEAGKAARSGISEEFRKRIAPAEEIYEAIETKFKGVPLDTRAFKSALSKLRKKYSVAVSSGAPQTLDEIEQAFSNVDDVAKLRNMRTSLGKLLPGTPSDAQKDIIGEMYDVLTRERNRSILKYAVSTGPKATRNGRAVGMLGELKKADKIYRTELTKTAGALGIEPQRKHSLKTAINEYLKTTPPEKIVRDLFNKGDYESMLKVKETFPEQYEVLRQRALKDLVEASTHNNNFSMQHLVTRLSKLGPEVQGELLQGTGPKMDAVRTALGAMPPNFNPSQTATKLQYLKLLNVPTQLNSWGLRKTLHGISPSNASMKAANPATAKNPQVIIQRLSSRPEGMQFVAPLQKALERGGAAFSANYYLLSQQYPEFRSLMEAEDDEQQ